MRDVVEAIVREVGTWILWFVVPLVIIGAVMWVLA